jgi:hypothetical protein
MWYIIVDGESLGKADVIKMINLQTRKERTILSASSEKSDRYDIYSFRLRANKLYFAALNKTTNSLVSGVIDTLKARDDRPESEFVTLQALSTVSGKIMQIEDIEPILPVVPIEDPGGDPKLVDNGLHFTNENPNSISIEFSKYMDKTSVQEHVKLNSEVESEADEKGEIPYIPLWTYKTVHLFPDLSENHLADNTPRGFSAGTAYTITFEDGIRDIYDRDLNGQPLTRTVSMAPKNGWYVGKGYADGHNMVAKGRSCNFNGNDNLPLLIDRNITQIKNIRISFDLIGNSDFTIGLSDENKTLLTAPMTSHQLGNYLSLSNYNEGHLDGNLIEPKETNVTENYDQWKTWRLDIYGSTFKAECALPNSQYETLYQKDDLIERNASVYNIRLVSPNAWGGVQIDNLKIATLNDNGTPSGDDGDILSYDFENGDLPDETKQ